MQTATRTFLRDFAVRRLGRDVDPTDPEVTELGEALERQLFKLGGRTNPGGYYLYKTLRSARKLGAVRPLR